MYEKYVRVFPGVLPLLSELKKMAVKTAIVTSSWFEEGDPEPIKRLKGMVDVLVTKFDTERHKLHTPIRSLRPVRNFMSRQNMLFMLGIAHWILRREKLQKYKQLEFCRV